MKYTLFYCYDAYCNWCYGFSRVIKNIAEEYKNNFQVEVLSGGMIITPKAKHISVIAGYIQKNYREVEERTGIKFGNDYLWHINNADLSDWYPSSENPAIALCVFKEFYPDMQVEFATDLQYALHYEGRDLCDDASYLHIIKKYAIEPVIFYKKLQSKEYKRQAYHEFYLCKRLQITDFPMVLLQLNASKFYLLSKGFTSYKELKERIRNMLAQFLN